MSTYSSPSIWSASSSLHARPVVLGRRGAVEPRLERVPLLERLDLARPRARRPRAARATPPPSTSARGSGRAAARPPRPPRSRTACPRRRRDRCDPRHLGDGGRDVLEVVRRDPRDDEVEGAVREREILGAADHVGLHPRRGIGADDLKPASRSRRATCPPPVATSSAVREPSAQLTIRSRSSPSRCSGAFR